MTTQEQYIPLTVGIDIGGTNTTIGLVTDTGEILYQQNLSTQAFDSATSFLEAIAQTIDTLLNESVVKVKLVGIGVGAPNGNFYSGNIEDAPNLKWKGIIPVAEVLRNRFNCPVILTNDANAAAVGEQLFGCAGNFKNFILITLGTGVGSGIVIDGKLHYGANGFAGEIGHCVTVPGGRPCGCGRQGCLEMYASSFGIRANYEEAAKSFPNSQLTLDKSETGKISARKVAEEAQAGNQLALTAYKIAGEMLGRQLANSIAHIGPEAIIFFGGLMNPPELILDPVREALDKHLLPIFKGSVKILNSALPKNSGAIAGAAALVWQQIKEEKALATVNEI